MKINNIMFSSLAFQMNSYSHGINSNQRYMKIKHLNFTPTIPELSFEFKRINDYNHFIKFAFLGGKNPN